jgi:hypothetical protein
MAISVGQTGFLARDGLHIVVDFHPAGGQVQVGDHALLFGQVLRAIEAGDGFLPFWPGEQVSPKARSGGGRFGIVVQGSVGDVDAELEGVSGGAAPAAFAALGGSGSLNDRTER